MPLTFEGEVYRIDKVEPRADFEGGATLRLGDDEGELSIWVPADQLDMLNGIKRLQRVHANLRAREGQYTASRDGASRSTKAVKLGLISISPVSVATAPKASAA